MEQFGLALILFAAFWVGCAAGYIAMRLKAQVAYEKGRNEAAADISALTERLNGRDLQYTEARQRAEAAAETITRMDGELRAEVDRRTIAEARLTLLPKYESELETRGKKIAEQQTELTKLHVSVSELSTRLEEMKRTSEDKITAIQALQSRVAESFQSMSAEALVSNNKAFLDLAGDALSRLQDSARGDLDQRQSLFGQIMEPLKSSLDRVDTRISELERDRAAAYAGLQQQVESMMRTQVSLQAETAHLATALRTPSSRGRWGEVQLRRVVELAGMIAHCDFIEPRGPEDSSRPDLIVQLPNFRQIVVDSKVSLAAYLESNDAIDEAARAEKRREHAAGVRAHVTQLSAKGYWDQFPQSPEFVIAFLPGESFFSAALEHDPELLEFGVERRVILATPTTLIALLRAVAWGWKQEMVSSNAREIRDLGKALYDRLRSLADNFTEVQRGLSRTTAAFNRTVGTFESNVIPAARRLRELGASTGDEIVSPPPVDSTPRSLQLLAEATEPAADSEKDKFDGLPTPLAKIGVPAASESGTAKSQAPAPVKHSTFEPQRPTLTAKLTTGVSTQRAQEHPRPIQNKNGGSVAGTPAAASPVAAEPARIARQTAPPSIPVRPVASLPQNAVSPAAKPVVARPAITVEPETAPIASLSPAIEPVAAASPLAPITAAVPSQPPLAAANPPARITEAVVAKVELSHQPLAVANLLAPITEAVPAKVDTPHQPSLVSKAPEPLAAANLPAPITEAVPAIVENPHQPSPVSKIAEPLAAATLPAPITEAVSAKEECSQPPPAVANPLERISEAVAAKVELSHQSSLVSKTAEPLPAATLPVPITEAVSAIVENPHQPSLVSKAAEPLAAATLPAPITEAVSAIVETPHQPSPVSKAAEPPAAATLPAPITEAVSAIVENPHQPRLVSKAAESIVATDTGNNLAKPDDTESVVVLRFLEPGPTMPVPPEFRHPPVRKPAESPVSAAV